MFKRILYEDWALVVPIIAFLLTFGVFLFYTVRAFGMKREKASKLSRLPLE